MKYIYAPWRNHYTNATEHAKQGSTALDNCVFCINIQANDDAAHFILKRFEHTYVLFNRYPYNAGHLLVVPLEHISSLAHLSKAARAEMMDVATVTTTIMEKTIHPHGFNIGFNLGKASGGSIPAHLHMHVLPRWQGDTNFLLTLDQTKVISSDIETMYQELKPHFDSATL